MYRKILVALDHMDPAQPLLGHVCALAAATGGSLLLVHVADGWVARNFDQLNLADSREMREDWRQLQETADVLREKTGLFIETHLALGSPSDEILKVATAESADLVAMASHGHRLVGDLLLGSTIEAVRHRAAVPILVIPAAR
jgi:manganese transport protein